MPVVLSSMRTHGQQYGVVTIYRRMHRIGNGTCVTITSIAGCQIDQIVILQV